MKAATLGLILVALTAMGLALVTPAHSAELDACAEHLPFGVPLVLSPLHATPVCHRGYAALVDDDLLVPRWVAYRLTESRTLGCGARLSSFHAEPLVAKQRRHARASDYANSGFDIGHQAPADDFAWDAGMMRDSFSLANAAPQIPGLNEAEWERLEENVRAWAWERGEVLVYVGPVFGGTKTIGKDKVAVPTGFWKIIVDPVRRQSLAFLMPQRAIVKGDLKPWETSIGAIAAHTSIMFPLPEGIDAAALPPLWDDATPAWRVAHRAACH